MIAALLVLVVGGLSLFGVILGGRAVEARVWRKSLISRSMLLILAILSSRSLAMPVFLSALNAGDSSCLFRLLISSSAFL